ncbi:hypothetical protein C2G38_853007 [Gigaspora rosea]|uniref:WD40-repeat-containing domain protein n=1 Tax=Gigaspora rosea TaxID=44941 RepID=A0A397U104_9GLOM|nr:hypothetical protein C2G38_853007 [Gigaspora rosea]
MTSNSDKPDITIPIEEVPDQNKNKTILEIVCSPKLKHVATLDEDSNISFWSIVGQEESLTNVNSIHINNIRTKETGEKIFAISDNKHVAISLNRVVPYNFKIFNFETEEIPLTFPDRQKEIDFLFFIDNGNIVVGN